ncbi:MAG: hypothetical protein VZQ55_06410 [Ruminococcus sp.]|nr:hypothetical protein [Ruminococcus sp.]
MIDININSSYPHTDEVYTNVLNKGGSKKINIAFFDDDIPLDLSSANVTATFVTNGFLIAEDIEVSKADNSNNIVILDITSNSAYTLIPGKMLVEFKFTKDDKELYPATAMCIYVKSSIRDNAKILPESIGTVAEIIKEVIKARKDFNDLDARLNDMDDRIVEAVIPDKAVTRNKIADKAVSGDKIDTGTIQSSNIGTGQVKTGNIDGGAVTNKKLGTDSVSTDKIQGGAVTFDKLGTDAQTVINNKLSYQRLVKNTGGVPTALQVEDLNSLNLDHNTFYYIWLAYGFLYPTQPREWAVILELESNNQLIITKKGDIYSREKVSGVWSDFINLLANRLKTTDYSIGFNSDGVMIKSSNLLILGAGDFNTECSSVYVSQNVTGINNMFFVTAPNVTDLYIDNNEGVVSLPSNIPVTVTVHYKDEFKLSDLLVNSDIASNTKLLNLENTLSGLINGDEVAY